MQELSRERRRRAFIGMLKYVAIAVAVVAGWMQSFPGMHVLCEGSTAGPLLLSSVATPWHASQQDVVSVT
jgi:hypothetical protein